MLDQVQAIAGAHQATLGQVFIAWLVAQPGMTSALAGARTADQAIENARAGKLRLTAPERAEMRAAVESLSFAL